MKTVLAMISAAVLALPAAAAFAQTHDEPASVIVSYADLDLSDPEGRTVLGHRIDAAIRRVCPSVNGRIDLREYAQHRDCRAVARADADQQLAAIYGDRVFTPSAVRVSAMQN